VTATLRTLARRGVERREAVEEPCDLCGRPIGAEHRHVLDLADRELRCACRPCAVLFDSPAAGAGQLRLVPERRLRLDDLELSDELWEGLRLPVDMAFFFRDTPAERVSAYYPSPMGPTESLLRLEAWTELEAANPVLGTLVPDVEALLVDRARGARRHWLVPIDECYALVGLIRTHWRGLTGGTEVWQQMTRFYDELDARARPASARTGGTAHG
jgi:Family of unknown function (DUF5947)